MHECARMCMCVIVCVHGCLSVCLCACVYVLSCLCVCNFCETAQSHDFGGLGADGGLEESSPAQKYLHQLSMRECPPRIHNFIIMCIVQRYYTFFQTNLRCFRSISVRGPLCARILTCIYVGINLRTRVHLYARLHVHVSFCVFMSLYVFT